MQNICLGAALSHLADAISVHPSFPVALSLAFQQQLAVVLKFPPQLVLSPSFKLDPIILAGWNPTIPIPHPCLQILVSLLSPPPTYTPCLAS